jgi:2-isopropylmalate synthase
MKTIEIYDTTLRDGEQAPGAAMHPEQKLAIALELQKLGVSTIEAGFPAASEKDLDSIKEICKLCKDTRIAAFARTIISDIEVALESVKKAVHPRITLVMPSSDLHIQSKLRMNHEQALEMLESTVKFARKHCAEVEVIAEDSTRSNPEFLQKLFLIAVSSGSDFFTLADTVGYATPSDIQKYLGVIMNTDIGSKNITFGIHCHDDLGLATINTLTGLEMGATQAHCTINGIGERAGNAALEEIIIAMTIRQDQFPFLHVIDTTHIWNISKMVSNMTSFIIPPNKPIVGSNAFSHGAGLHQDGMLKDTNMYEIFTPSRVGAPGRTLPITRHSGRKGLANKLKELGIHFDKDEVNTIYDAIQKVIGEKKFITDSDLLRVVSRFKNK